MYTVQNKVLPGAYINFVSAARASATLGDRGTAAFPLSLDWGPENEGVTIENAKYELTNGTVTRVGMISTSNEAKPNSRFAVTIERGTALIIFSRDRVL